MSDLGGMNDSGDGQFGTGAYKEIKKHLHFTVLTLFPDLIRQNAEASIIGRALAAGHFGLDMINIRDYANNRYGKVDDSLYGGGTGMLLACEPIYAAWQVAQKAALARLHPAADGSVETAAREVNRSYESLPEEGTRASARTIYLSPKGRVLNQDIVNELAEEEELILLCGHYEGVDERVLEEINAEELSIGDYVLTGGELAASIVIDAVARTQQAVLPNHSAFQDESLYNTRLECRQYTKPEIWKNRRVPEILLSGHHAKIAKWREQDGLSETVKKRKDLFDKLDLSENELIELIAYINAESAQDMATGEL